MQNSMQNTGDRRRPVLCGHIDFSLLMCNTTYLSSHTICPHYGAAEWEGIMQPY